MKRIIFLTVLIFVGFLTLNAQNNNDWSNNNSRSAKLTKSNSNSKSDVTWEETIIDLGKVKYQQPQIVIFKMKNTSSKPILITNAETSCGCTDAEFPRKPIAPGKTANISVTYEADDIGTFHKTITLTMIIEDSRQILHIKGEVVK